jgi:hypothetical protein
MTVAELQERVSAEEFDWWIAYDRINPISKERDDYHAALISATIANSVRTRGKPIKVSDMLFKFGENTKVSKCGDMLKMMYTIAEAETCRLSQV